MGPDAKGFYVIYLRLRRVTPRGLLLLRAERVGVGGAVVVAGHDLLLRLAHAAPVVGGAGLHERCRGAQAGLDDSDGKRYDVFAGYVGRDGLQVNGMTASRR
jgi:hypothetical protein